MPRPARAVPVLVLAVMLGATACSPGVQGTFAERVSTTAAPTTPSPGGPTGGPETGALPDPCGLVNDATVARFVEAPVENPYAGGSDFFRACSWRTGSTGATRAYGSLSVQLVLTRTIGTSNGAERAKRLFEADKNRTSVLGPVEEVEGLGDDAFHRYRMLSRLHSTRLQVLVGNVTVSVDYNSSAPASKQASVDAARAVAAEVVAGL